MPKCVNCMYWQPRLDAARPAGDCMRYPPVPVYTRTGVVSEYPETFPGEWCGEYIHKGPGKVLREDVKAAADAGVLCGPPVKVEDSHG